MEKEAKEKEGLQIVDDSVSLLLDFWLVVYVSGSYTSRPISNKKYHSEIIVYLVFVTSTPFIYLLNMLQACRNL